MGKKTDWERRQENALAGRETGELIRVWCCQRGAKMRLDKREVSGVWHGGRGREKEAEEGVVVV